MAFRNLIPWGREDDRLSRSYRRETDEYPFASLQRDMNRLFDDAFRGLGAPFKGSFGGLDWPQVELGETDKEIRVTAELPGLDEKDVELLIEDNILTLRGEKRSEIDDRERNYSERSYGRFERRIALPRSIDKDKAAASFKNGVLTVTAPKSEAGNQNVRRIPVNG